MYIPFDKISEDSRVWIYSSDTEFTSEQIDFISKKLEDFTNSWESHQIPVYASFNIVFNRFIIIAADEQQSSVSGCGIDKIVHFIKSVEQQLTINLTGSSNLFFKYENGFQLIPFQKIKEKIANGEIKSTDLYCNTLASTVSDVKKSFLTPAEDSWLKKYFKPVLN